MKVLENFKEFLDLASINQGPNGWSIYGANPKKKKKTNNRRPHRLNRLGMEGENLSIHTPN
jgi:hypothetical protein